MRKPRKQKLSHRDENVGRDKGQRHRRTYSLEIPPYVYNERTKRGDWLAGIINKFLDQIDRDIKASKLDIAFTSYDLRCLSSEEKKGPLTKPWNTFNSMQRWEATKREVISNARNIADNNLLGLVEKHKLEGRGSEPIRAKVQRVDIRLFMREGKEGLTQGKWHDWQSGETPKGEKKDSIAGRIERWFSQVGKQAASNRAAYDAFPEIPKPSLRRTLNALRKKG